VPAEDILVQPDELSSNIKRWFHAEEESRSKGSTLEELIASMDECGVEKSLMSARMIWHHPATRPRVPFQSTSGMPDDIFDTFLVELGEAMRRYPGRIYGSVLIDPWGAMRAVRQLERAVKDYGV